MWLALLEAVVELSEQTIEEVPPGGCVPGTVLATPAVGAFGAWRGIGSGEGREVAEVVKTVAFHPPPGDARLLA